MGLVSGAPDWDVLIWVRPAARRGAKVFPSHWDSFPHGRSGKAWGISVQVAIMAVSVAIVVALRPQA